MVRRRRQAAAIAVPEQEPKNLGLNMESVARFLYASNAKSVMQIRDVFAARAAELGIAESPSAVLARPVGLSESPNFNVRALINFAEAASKAKAPAVQAILATARVRVG